jgi:hypothetical protein
VNFFGEKNFELYQNARYNNQNFRVSTLRSPPVILTEVSILHIFLIVCCNELHILKMPEYLLFTLCPFK